MNRISKALQKLQELNSDQQRNIWINKINPVAKLIVLIVYLIGTVSFKNDKILPLLSMALFPLIIFFSANISFIKAIKQMNFVFPIIFVMAIFNPIFDRIPVLNIQTKFGILTVTSGMISCLTLIIKSFLTVFSTYILISSTSIEKICAALKKIKLPDIIIIQIMLTFRYLTVLLEQAEKITQAYKLRAPGQKGIHYKAWGSLVGNLLLQSFDRAQEIYEAMCLRGFSGNYFLTEKISWTLKDFFYLIISISFIIIFRIFPVFEITGNLLTKLTGVF